MSSKTLRPPPRRVSRATGASTSSIINSSGFNSKRKERDENGFEKPKRSASPPITTAPKTNLLKMDTNFKCKEKNGKGLEKSKHFASPPTTTVPTTNLLKPDKPRSGLDPTKKGSKHTPNNQLLAGYLAHEFLTKGTVLGRQDWGKSPSKSDKEESLEQKLERYAELACLLKSDGAHLDDIVNPNQLDQFLKSL